MRRLFGVVTVGACCRNLEGNGQSASRIVFQFKSMGMTVKLVETRACVCKPKSPFEQLDVVMIHREARAVVSHFDMKHAVFASGLDFDQARRRTRSDAMANRVFDDGLENEVGDSDIERLRLDVYVDGQSILKTNLLDLEIAF